MTLSNGGSGARSDVRQPRDRQPDRRRRATDHAGQRRSLILSNSQQLHRRDRCGERHAHRHDGRRPARGFELDRGGGGTLIFDPAAAAGSSAIMAHGKPGPWVGRDRKPGSWPSSLWLAVAAAISF